MSSTHNKRIVNEMKDEMISLYEKLIECTRKRNVANIRINERKIREMEVLLTNRFIRVYDCQCESDEDSDEAYENYMKGRQTSCISCLRDFVEREKLKYPPLLDKLNWGLTGFLKAPLSEESSGVTSSDDDEQKPASYSRHKVLRKLRREGPDKFELKYFSTGVEEFLKMEVGESELKNMLATESAQDLLAKREQSKKKFVPKIENFDDYAGGLYDISSDDKLKPKYSDTRFEFIAHVISDLQTYLNHHSKDYYPNVSEVISCSENAFCKEQEALRHYYNVFHKRFVADVSKPNSEDVKKSLGSDVEGQLSYCTTYQELYPFETKNLPAEEINQARKCGVLNLSGKSLPEVPELVWLMDKAPVEYKVPHDVSWITNEIGYKPLQELDLSANNLTKITPDGSCLNTLVTLKLANNSISKLPSAFKRLTSLRYLDLAGNKLQKLPKALGRITTLVRLNVSNNGLKSVPDELRNLNDLKTLDLRWNKLKRLPNSLSELRSLKVLNAAYNRLRNIPTDIKNVSSLVVLDVSYNKIPILPSLSGLARMIVFNASGNYIKQFPSLADCKRLCEIRLDGNRIKSLNVDFMKNVPVVQLTLSYNKISKIPDNYYQLETLVLLDLTGNRLDWLPWSLARLKYLSCLKVELNPIKNVRGEDIKEGSKRILEILLRNLLYYERDDEMLARAKREAEGLFFKTDSSDVLSETASKEEDALSIEASHKNINLLGKTAIPIGWLQEFAASKVSSLDLTRNHLGWLPYPITMLADHLKQLYVRHNCFRSLPEFIQEFKNLKILDLSGNHLTALPQTIVKCPLCHLVCQFNEFTQIPKALYKISTLTLLDFSYNNIASLNVEGLKNLKDLKTLNLRCNEIKLVPSALGFLINITELDLHENSFKYPEQAVLDKGTQDVMAYLRKHDDNDVLYKYQKNTKKQVTISKIPVKHSELTEHKT